MTERKSAKRHQFWSDWPLGTQFFDLCSLFLSASCTFPLLLCPLFALPLSCRREKKHKLSDQIQGYLLLFSITPNNLGCNDILTLPQHCRRKHCAVNLLTLRSSTVALIRMPPGCTHSLWQNSQNFLKFHVRTFTKAKPNLAHTCFNFEQLFANALLDFHAHRATRLVAWTCTYW